MMKNQRSTNVAGIIAAVLFCFSCSAGAQEQGSEQQKDYEVVPHRAQTTGLLWASDGPTVIIDGDTSVGNRFILGADLRLGPQGRFEIGWSIIDVITSGESTESVGDISRIGTGPNFGYFIVPDRFWAMYTFSIQSVEGSRVSGSVTTYAHQLGLGYRFYTNQNFSLGAEFSYMYAPRVSVPVLDLNANLVQDAVYEAANILTLSLVFGFDIG